jgi:hypothetical protein
VETLMRKPILWPYSAYCKKLPTNPNLVQQISLAGPVKMLLFWIVAQDGHPRGDFNHEIVAMFF